MESLIGTELSQKLRAQLPNNCDPAVLYQVLLRLKIFTKPGVNNPLSGKTRNTHNHRSHDQVAHRSTAPEWAPRPCRPA